MSSARTHEGDATAAAARVRELRSRTGLTQEQLAARLGVSFATVNRWENGRSGMSPAVRRRFGDLEQETAAQRTSPGAPPVPFSSFVGREPEIAALTSLLPGSRLTSLVGPGGSGKTRLILEVLRRRPAGALRVVFVAMDLGMDLVGDPALASARVASARGIRAPPGVPAAVTVTQALAREPALLVLDGAEHVAGGVASLTTMVLGGAPEARVVVTSRCVLDVPGEQVWPVPVLACPAPGAGAQEVASSDAVRLFATRAAERRPDFRITGELAQPVAELCRRLDGLPLAIELAASWVGTLSVGEILDHRFDLPEGDQHARTLHAVAESSHTMLAAGERAVLRDLSVLAGPFTLTDAAAITAVPPDRLVHSLRRLVNSSWLIARQDHDQSAYRMLDTLREYAAEQLTAAGGRPRARDRHGRHFAALAAASEQSLAGPERARWITALEQATADLEAALTWARETGEITAGLEMSTALCRWWLTTGRLAEGRRWLAAFTARADPRRGDAVVARAWSAAAMLAAENGDYQPAIELAARALRVFDSLGAVAAAAQAATVLGAAYRYQGEHAAALRYLELAVAHRRRLGDEAGVVAALNNVAMIAVDTGDFGRAQRLLEETLALKRALGHPRSVALNLVNLADVFLKTGQADRAAQALTEAADLGADLGDVQLTGAITCNQGDLARMRSDFTGAAGYYRRALECYRAAGNAHDVVLALCGLGRRCTTLASRAAAPGCSAKPRPWRSAWGTATGCRRSGPPSRRPVRPPGLSRRAA